MKKIISLLTIVLSASVGFGQLTILSPDHTPSNPVDCANFTDASVANFFDDGGATGNYAPGLTETFTVCPDLSAIGPKIAASFGNSPGFVWDVHGSDTLFVYDGPNTSSPLLGAYNNGNAIGGFSHSASWANATGCLTFKFVSDGANQGAGWAANIQCISPPQEIEMHIEAFINGTAGNDMSPIDTGYVDICQGDSVLLVAKPIFPYSFENTGSGYSQNVNNIDYAWEFSNGFVGPNNDSIWFKPTVQGGFYGSLMITDSKHSTQANKFRVRTSTTPSFLGTGSLKDTICYGQETQLSGGVTSADTVGVDVPEGSFQLGGSFAGITYLPDGSGGPNADYSTVINMSGFPAGSTVTSAADIERMCVNMEHSYLGDLEMWLVCPDGTEVNIFNAYYSTGHFPAGFSPGKVLLGEPLLPTGTGPGVGYEYCFSSTQNNLQDFESEYQNSLVWTPVSTTYQAMDPDGIYAPEESYAGFIGCPLNGAWTLHVQDNWSVDDGWIFEWGIYFAPYLYPDNEFYQNTITDAYWSQHPSIVSDTTNDTLIVISPNSTGDHFYTFNVEDDFGCSYDTIIKLHVLDTVLNVVSLDTSLFCFFNDSIPLWSKATGTVSPFEYAWADGQTGDTAFHQVFENGVYEYLVTVTDGCGIKVTDTAFIRMNQTLSIDSLKQFPAECGMENGAVLAYPSGFTGTPSYKWTGPGTGNPANTVATAWLDKPAGWYYFTVSDNVCMMQDSILLEQDPPPTASFTPTPSSGPAPLGVAFINTSDDGTNYDWDFGNGSGNSTPNKGDQYTVYNEDGTYTITLIVTSGACSDQATETVYVYLPIGYDMTNVFTPNGDGENDLFTVNAENATDFEMVILNRWGNVVFETNDIKEGWNGKVNNSGAVCADGTYFYKFTIKGQGNQEKEEHGFLQLVSGKK